MQSASIDQPIIDFDCLVIGGGVNGTGIAADAAGRGLKVLLCEMNDLASATSSNSSKLIHGGLRYLEYYEFRLVREALAEREVLLANAPHIMWPLRFRLPHRPHLRPAWMIRAGLFLYDHLAKRKHLKGSHGISFKAEGSLKPDIKKGFEYADGWVDDARLVVLNSLAAQHHGATIKTRTRCINAERFISHGELIWQVSLQDINSGDIETINCRSIVNAAGPWVSSIFPTLHLSAPKQVRLVKGSHIVVPRIHDEPEAYILQNEDNRIVFVIPYENEFSLIGTTDVEHNGDPSSAEISEEEEIYLIDIVNQHFKHQITREDIVWRYAGVRPLMDDEAESASAVTRDYTIEVNHQNGMAPLLSIFGGKITTYRKLSEAAVDHLNDFFPNLRPAWTANAALPGGRFGSQDELFKELQSQFSWMPEAVLQRYVRSYGTLAYKLLDGANQLTQMGIDFGAGLYQREVDYLINSEWAQTLEDVIWRRSKRGLFLNEEQQRHLDHYLKNRLSGQTSHAA